MRPAELAKALFMVACIGRMIVAANDPGEGIAKHFSQYFGAATGRDMKEYGPWRDKSPEKATFALVFPASFIDIEGRGGCGIPFDDTDHRHTGLGDPFGRIADGTGGDGETKQRLHNLRNPSAGEAMN